MALLQCVCCDKVLRPVRDADKDGDCFQPVRGVSCTSSGNFGSAVFDPIAPEERDNELLFFLCDECLVKKKDAIYLLQAKREEPIPAVSYLRL